MIAQPPLHIAIRPAQTIESVLRHGLRFRFTVDPSVERAISANMECGGEDAGQILRVIRHAHGHPGVRVQNIAVRRAMRTSEAITCRLVVATYGVKPKPYEFLALKSAHVKLRTT